MGTKKAYVIALAAALAFASSCATQTPSGGSQGTGEPKEPVTVFAAASMTEAMDEIGKAYKASSGVDVVFSYESSGTLKDQIVQGAECDIFLSAAQKQMNDLNDASLVDQSTRYDIVENKVVLVVPDANPKNIHTFEDAAKANIAIGNSSVPVGAYTEEIFTAMGLWGDDLLSHASLGSNVKEVTTWVKEGTVDCGVVYETDAKTAGLTVVANPPEGTLTTRVLYPIAVLTNAKNPEGAKAFLEYLKTSAAKDTLASFGFSPL